ncbi:MAG: nucleotide exchange factor GrpE [Parcubacteria group bacterium CG11_big_fil_rev_8_21_14_0_20_39_14]|nr:MAG: nucleotide exchange factor GrpE [Parcubacteria group bacterium CG11_big_fil_rev_8_21_14_0_20_39_14]PIS35296.1 MAG: nucleotide exchange factor GrpE [Parcubacteria group bacterium CG08_land_8_20_14_0_20_38_56]
MEDEEDKNLEPKELPDDLEKCRENLAKLEKERSEYLAGWQRERADFLNYKKAQTEIFEGFQKMTNQMLILEILPVLDNLELSLKHFPQSLKDDEWVKGLIQIYENFKDILKEQGVEEFKSRDEKFNPEFHEAVEKVESEKEEGIIVEEIQKGYTLNGRVIRPARVKVAARSENSDEKKQEKENK